jgi:DNA invertase Pin-like site-specific DNA recombinase
MPASQNTPTPVAQYLRMSTEHQQYSLDNQIEAICRYATQHQMEVVKTYSDAGKSGLTLRNRPALKQLLDDVEGGETSYSAILVYDISRWGRFQDADESAYYEYRCRRANVAVHYCAEQFPNDGTPYAALLKTIKRMMAAEYSRELSVKVFAGQARLTERGFRQGGTAGYGLRRMLVDIDGKPKFLLEGGQEKSISTDRVMLTPGPQEEIAVVNEVFRLYAFERLSSAEIARVLNAREIPCIGGRPWTRYIVRRMVTNPKYIGANVSNRVSAKLRGRRVQNPPEMWIRKDNAFPAIVALELFERAGHAEADGRFQTDEQLLERLRRLLKKNGKLTERLIRDDVEMPCAQVYASRFGGLAEAYRRIGYQPARDLTFIERDRRLWSIRKSLIVSVTQELEAHGVSVRQDGRTKLLFVNDDVSLRVIVSPCRARKRFQRWKLNLYSPLEPDLTVIARLAPGNDAILDYYCIPWSARSPKQFAIGRKSGNEMESYRNNDLGLLITMAQRNPSRG